MATGFSRPVFLCTAALLFLAGASQPALAKILVSEEVKYYTVNGLNGLDLGRSMLRGGARTIHLRDAIAATTTEFDFLNPKLAIENGRCVVKSVTIHLKITYQFPKWRTKGSAPATVRKHWDAFYAELVRHERRHGQIAKKFAGKVEREMLRLAGTAAFGCNDFGAFTSARFNALSNQLKQLQIAFDRRENRSTSRIFRLQLTLLKSN